MSGHRLLPFHDGQGEGLSRYLPKDGPLPYLHSVQNEGQLGSTSIGYHHHILTRLEAVTSFTNCRYDDPLPMLCDRQDGWMLVK